MLELDAVDRLAGVLDGGERPAALAQVPSVGRYGQVEMETLLSLRPDLVLLWPDSVPRSQREQLQQFGIPVLVVAQTRLDGLAEQFRVIGQAVDRTEQGERLAEGFAPALPSCAQPTPVNGRCGCSTRSGTARCIPSAGNRSSAKPSRCVVGKTFSPT